MTNLQIMVLKALSLILSILLESKIRKKKGNNVNLFHDWKLDLRKLIYANQVGTPNANIKFGKDCIE